jgi:hypothetical protein
VTRLGASGEAGLTELGKADALEMSVNGRLPSFIHRDMEPFQFMDMMPITQGDPSASESVAAGNK